MSDQSAPKEDPTEKFYALYGRCINEWAFVEERYFDFFAFALGATRKNAAILFYEWKEFSTPAKLTNSLMENVLHKGPYKAHLKSWSAIAKKIERHRPFRNELAHEPIRGFRRLRISFRKKPPLTEEERKKSGLGQFHEVYRSPIKVLGGRNPKLFKNTLPVIRIEHLEEHHKEVRAIREALNQFATELDQSVRARALRLSAYIELRRLRPQPPSDQTSQRPA